MSELPLFPLQTVLLPDGLLALRVFETRYLDMVARCLRGANRFGVVAIREGAEVGAATTYDFGTSAEIVDWHQQQGGLLGILAAGRESFRLRETRRKPATGRLITISAADPLNLAGIVTTGERVRTVAGTRIVYRDGVPLAALEGEFVRSLSDQETIPSAEIATALAGRRMPPILTGFVGR